MLSLSVVALLLAGASMTATADPTVNMVVREANTIVRQATIPHVFIRQCSCQEMDTCLAEMFVQSEQCLDSCWSRTSSLTANTAALRQCLVAKEPSIRASFECGKRAMNACTNGRTAAQTPRIDLHRALDLVEQHFLSNRRLINSAISTPTFTQVVNAAYNVSGCVKQCFAGKQQSRGYCFDRIGCQPRVSAQGINSVTRQCISVPLLKRDASELCDCALQAGVKELANVCPLLRIMARRQG